MKITVKIEDGRPLLVFPMHVDAKGMIEVFSPVEGIGTAQRAYLKRLPYPSTPEQIEAAWSLIQRYASRG